MRHVFPYNPSGSPIVLGSNLSAEEERTLQEVCRKKTIKRAIEEHITSNNGMVTAPEKLVSLIYESLFS